MNNYIPKRLIDTNILSQLITKNPILNKIDTRLIAYDMDMPKQNIVIPNVSKLEKKIDKLKNTMMSEMTPTLINGILFIITCLLIYYVLSYRYNKKKSLMNK